MEQALALHEALSSIHAAGQALDADGCWTEALDQARKQLGEQVVLEYLDVVDVDTFEPQRKKGKGAAYAVVAAHVQGVRLIDNMRVA
jgi:pantothenate synthetase